MTNGDTIYIDCDCVAHCNALALSVWQRGCDGPEIYIQVYRKAMDRGKLFWRLRAAWFAFRKGEWGGYEIDLDEKRIERLVEVCHFALGNPETEGDKP